MNTTITEIIPEEIFNDPDLAWAKEAFEDGQFFNIVIERNKASLILTPVQIAKLYAMTANVEFEDKDILDARKQLSIMLGENQQHSYEVDYHPRISLYKTNEDDR